jgi:hypothetical protein
MSQQSLQHNLGDSLTNREINKAVKDIFKETFHNLGGAAWLQRFVSESDANARVFVTVLAKLIPPQSSEKERPNAVVIDLPWVQQGRLSYRQEIENSTEVLQER